MASNIEKFGVTSDGQNVQRILLSNGVLSAAVITYGASLQDLRFVGHDAPLVLGLNDIDSYEKHALYFGAIVGRCANRIANGRFMLAGESHQVTLTDDQDHHLHGGPVGFANRVWKVSQLTESKVELSLGSADGDMGYPGALQARCIYELRADGVLYVELEAESDEPTLCNLVNHAYFNLEDGGRGDVNLHRVQISASQITAVNDELIPTGVLEDVSGTKNDFRSIRPIGDFNAYDLNFCLANQRRELTNVARVVAPSSGMQMDIATTEAGMQLYTGKYISENLIGLDGVLLGSGSGLCLESQVWPDAINHRDFPNAILMPGQILKQVSSYSFSKIA